MLTRVRYLSSEQRLLVFFEMLCKKYFIQTIDSQKKLHLPMSKGDIASYLGMRPESVSRALRNLQNQGVIQYHLKTIEIKDLNVAKKMICKA
ncbi:MAG: helix-turn-helix domain-containing protein [Gammaproteobacteria bacterium]|nr:helix-turn-helix domain-containing protein [Gammaproteobacteria bacterium]